MHLEQDSCIVVSCCGVIREQLEPLFCQMISTVLNLYLYLFEIFFVIISVFCRQRLAKDRNYLYVKLTAHEVTTRVIFQPFLRASFSLGKEKNFSFYYSFLNGFQSLNPIAWVNIPVFDFRSRLLMGEHKLPMWPVTAELQLWETGCYPLGKMNMSVVCYRLRKL